MLEEAIDPLITDAVENQRDDVGNAILNEDFIHFQLPHYARYVRDWLGDRFPERWIGRREPIEWPIRSPDLIPNDFFLWDHLKSVVYKTVPQNIEDLKNRITAACRAIPRETFQNVRQEFEQRLFYCLQVNGEHFEQLIK